MTSIGSSASPPDPPYSATARASTLESDANRTRAKRSSKACESCRVRRTRCSGTVPCEACIANGIATTCHVRVKARPQRALSAKIQPPRPPPDPLSLPIAGIELALAQWLLPHPHIPISSLLFVEDDRLRILNTFAPPIPPGREFEDDLIHAFVATSEFYTVEHMDKPQLVSLYSRYRAVPNSITEDQRALVYAALCVARYIQSTEQGVRDGPLEDVTYFTMACDELLKWSRPSIYAAWALFCLISYSAAFGGPAETRRLIEQMAWHVRELGLHRQETASMYGSKDMVGVLLSALTYMDTMMAGLLEHPPCLPFAEIDIRPIILPSIYTECLVRTVHHESDLLRDLADPDVDVRAPEYVCAREAEWAEALRDIRMGNVEAPQPRRTWAELRYGWLRLLLHAPNLPHSSPHVARAISQILHTYIEADAIGHYRASWPQHRQLSTVGHLLILISAQGELHHREAQRLWELLVGFLSRDTYARTMVDSFVRAAAVLGVEVAMPPKTDMPPGVAEVDGQRGLMDGGMGGDIGGMGAMNWGNAPLPMGFDPLAWFTVGGEFGLPMVFEEAFGGGDGVVDPALMR